jgi:tRNA (Thr-GGU) A37 N-methylase
MHTGGIFVWGPPVRPNPIASSIVELVAIDAATLQVRPDCLTARRLSI